MSHPLCWPCVRDWYRYIYQKRRSNSRVINNFKNLEFEKTSTDRDENFSRDGAIGIFPGFPAISGLLVARRRMLQNTASDAGRWTRQTSDTNPLVRDEIVIFHGIQADAIPSTDNVDLSVHV